MKTKIQISLFALFISTISMAQVPSTINFQGILTDSNDELIEGSSALTFRIYDEAVAGNLLWEEEQSNVIINKGVFNVLIGSVTPLDLDFDIPYYLSFQRGNESELDPRIDLSSVPYSFVSNKANNVYGETNMVPSTGNVGFGTTDPTQTVDINGAIRIRGGSPGVGKVLTSDANGIANWQTVNTGVDGITPSGGKIGIGTTNPQASLHVEEAGADDPLRVRVDALTKLIIKNDGKIGVLTTDPTHDFDVNGTVRLRGGTPGAGKVLTSDANGVASWTTPTSGGVAGINSNGGKIGIGTTTQKVALSVNGKTYIKGDGDQGTGDTHTPTIDLSVDDSDTGLEVPADGILTMFTNNEERVRITGTGQMGVGTTVPNSKFQINAITGDAMRVQISGNTKFFIAADGKVGIGGFFTPSYDLDVSGTIGGNGVSYHSDKRWKKNITTLGGSLELVKSLRGVSYNWKKEQFKEMKFNDRLQIGFVAQEVEEVMPELVDTDVNGFKSVKYANITAVLVEAIKAQQKQIELLQKQLLVAEQAQDKYSAELNELKITLLEEIRKQSSSLYTASN